MRIHETQSAAHMPTPVWMRPLQLCLQDYGFCRGRLQGRSDDSKLGAYTLARGAGTGIAWDDFTDSRNHTYAGSAKSRTKWQLAEPVGNPDNRRLDTESFLPEPSASTRTFDYDFDSDDLGVRVAATLDNPAIDAWEVNDPETSGLDAFMRVVDETARSGKRSFTVSGSSTGPGVFELFLGEGASPSSYEFLQSIDPDVDYGDGIWSIPLSLEAGQYKLEARGTHLHPDSNHQVTDSSTFTVAAPDPNDITTIYDAHGRVETRSWASGDVVQTFSWDAKGNLLEIEQIDSGSPETAGSYVWTAQYDGLGRRIITDYAPAGASAIAIAHNRIKTWFDPQVEFMAAAVEHHGKREWLVHGPDLDTGYGSFQGLGGLETLVNEATGETTPIVDTVHGHIVATIDLGDIANAADDAVVFKEQQFGGYGPLPGSLQQSLEVTESLSESLGWQTRCVDPTSFFVMGARHYDPLSGRFLSADPLGHGATPDLYSYAGGDPINFLDPTGRGVVAGNPVENVNPLGVLGDAINAVDGVTYNGSTLIIKRSPLQNLWHAITGGGDVPGAEGYDLYMVGPEYAAELAAQQQFLNAAEKLAISEAADAYERRQQREERTKHELPPGERRTMEENKQARDYFKTINKMLATHILKGRGRSGPSMKLGTHGRLNMLGLLKRGVIR